MKKVDSINERLLLTFLVLLTILVILVVFKITNMTGKSEEISDQTSKENSASIEKVDTSDFKYLENFELDSNDKYRISTDSSMLTMQNDGGSNTNIYYAIDLKTKKLYQVEDVYVGFEGYKWQNKINYLKLLSDSDIKELKRIIEQMIKNPENTMPYNSILEEGLYYIVSTNKKDQIKVYNRGLIDEFNNIVKE